ncbi:hypothetical protein MOX02_36530 [Methylobacterium oxalidis]|uniref:Uncharacterized protein n=1 Tax=Methylobacterium oxalidis TaxID=944322 RepID=A0A512J6K3_9HYPH|nr:hypothetical protein MOX02_36530 [Methylobacterium oxalidis]GLS65405.1 hypothetical protein GCM10007888_37870 [Methylobacterium oxalidis]
MAGAQARTVHIRSIRRSRDLEIRRSGVARSRPAADRPGHEAAELPARQLTAHELIQMAQAARRAQPQSAGSVLLPGAGKE